MTDTEKLAALLNPAVHGVAANVMCCGEPAWGVEIRGLYDGIAYWECPSCGTAFRRWSDEVRPDLAERVERWASRHGVSFEEPTR